MFLRGRTSRLINARRRSFGRLAVLSAYVGGGWFKKRRCPSAGARRRSSFAKRPKFLVGAYGRGPGGVHPQPGRPGSPSLNHFRARSSRPQPEEALLLRAGPALVRTELLGRTGLAGITMRGS